MDFWEKLSYKTEQVLEIHSNPKQYRFGYDEIKEMLKKHSFEVKPDPGQFFFGENFFIRKIPIKCKFKTFFNIFFRCIIRHGS